MLFRQIDTILLEFRPCFSRKAAFYWFLIVVVGFIVRCDNHGASSFIRWLFLCPEHYDPLLRFFRANSWKLESLLSRWVQIAIHRCSPLVINGRRILIGDGIKVCKEAKKMPAVKSLHQESDNSGKGEYIFGHHFGYVGLLIGNLAKAFCLPLQGRIHEGIGSICPEEGFGGKPATLVTRMARLVVLIVQQIGLPCYVSLDAYFAVGPVFLIFKETVNKQGTQLVHLITRAKDNYVAYYNQEKVNLKNMFDFPDLFEKIDIQTYGRTKTVEYTWADLLWKPVNGLIRFVWVKDGQGCYILMCSDLQLPAPDIITIYAHRAKIEVMFLFLKHIIGGFCYHFWTKAFPKIKRGETLDYSTLSEKSKEKFVQTVEAIECFVNLAGIAMGILQFLSLTQAKDIWTNYNGWLRTHSSEYPSEEVVQNVVRAEFFSALEGGKVAFCRTLQVISDKKRKSPPLDQAA